MQIQLKQVEIVAALKQYVTSQGFDLVGKAVEISFTAGRKEAGFSAEISIDDTQLPDLSDPSATPLTLVKGDAAVSVAPAADSAPTPEVGEASAKSLFGSP